MNYQGGMLIMLDRQGPKPLHAQLEDIIIQNIENEYWKPNSAIPSENEFSKMYGLSRMTVRSVITRLVHSGLLYRVQGKGTYVSIPKIISKSLSQVGISKQLEEMGYDISTKLILIKKEIVPLYMQKELNIPKGSEVYFVQRLRSIKNEPLSIHNSHVPSSISPFLELKDLEGAQLCDILENQYNVKISKVVETLESCVATSSVAEMLKVEPGFPLLLLRDLFYSTDNIPIKFSEVLFRGDKIKLRQEYFK
jgi:GntR family transcriptional regulator